MHAARTQNASGTILMWRRHKNSLINSFMSVLSHAMSA